MDAVAGPEPVGVIAAEIRITVSECRANRLAALEV
jgi:hypothetical protein